jgi:hypothetical protein
MCLSLQICTVSGGAIRQRSGNGGFAAQGKAKQEWSGAEAGGEFSHRAALMRLEETPIVSSIPIR